MITTSVVKKKDGYVILVKKGKKIIWKTLPYSVLTLAQFCAEEIEITFAIWRKNNAIYNNK